MSMIGESAPIFSREKTSISTPRRKAEPGRPKGWAEFVWEVVAKAETHLWAPEGTKALAYLRGRGLSPETIRSARLGYWPADTSRTGLYEKPVSLWRGVTIPWIEGPTIEALNFRRPVKGKSKGKYLLMQGSRRTCYPRRSIVLAGAPLVLAEGELDALLLNQELRGLAAALTLGSASDRKPSLEVLLAMSAAAPWYLAGDTDPAGNASAESWLARSGRCRRVEPPRGKDWTDSYLAGVDLRSWWERFLGVIPIPPGPADRTWVNPESFEGAEAEPAPDTERWRLIVAGWPPERWAAWRRRSEDLQAMVTAHPTPEIIRQADRLAFLELAGSKVVGTAAPS